MHCLQPSLLLSLLLLGSDALVNAAILNFHVRTPSLADPPSSSPFTRRSRHFARADSTNSSSLSSRSTIPVLNTLNAEYISNITLGGRTIPVLLDTGRHALACLFLGHSLVVLTRFFLFPFFPVPLSLPFCMIVIIVLTFGLLEMSPGRKIWERKYPFRMLLVPLQVCCCSSTLRGLLCLSAPWHVGILARSSYDLLRALSLGDVNTADLTLNGFTVKDQVSRRNQPRPPTPHYHYVM